MKVLKHGTRVKTVIGEIEGLITEVSLMPNAVHYKISYFSNGEHTVAWLYDFEMEVCIKRKAGFGVVNEEVETSTLLIME